MYTISAVYSEGLVPVGSCPSYHRGSPRQTKTGIPRLATELEGGPLYEVEQIAES